MSLLNGIRFVSSTQVELQRQKQKQAKQKRQREQGGEITNQRSDHASVQRHSYSEDSREKQRWMNPALDNKLSNGINNEQSEVCLGTRNAHKKEEKKKKKKKKKVKGKAKKKEKKRRKRRKLDNNTKKDEQSEDSSSSSANDNVDSSRNRKTVMGSAARMGWMLSKPKRQLSQEQKLQLQKARDIAEANAKKEAIEQEKIDRGLIDPSTRQPYGLSFPTRVGHLEREEVSSRTNLVYSDKSIINKYSRKVQRAINNRLNKTEKNTGNGGKRAIMPNNLNKPNETVEAEIPRNKEITRLSKKAIVGDGGRSWRQKAAQRARENRDQPQGDIVDMRKYIADLKSKTSKSNNNGFRNWSHKRPWKSHQDEKKKESCSKAFATIVGTNQIKRSRKRGDENGSCSEKDEIIEMEVRKRMRKIREAQKGANENDKYHETKQEEESRTNFLYRNSKQKVKNNTPGVSVLPKMASIRMSKNEMNRLSAKAMKARIMGDIETANILDEQLKAARSASEDTQLIAPLDANGNILSSLIKHEGRDAPLEKEDTRYGKKRGKLKNQTDSENMTLNEIIKQERQGGEDMDEMYIRNIVRAGSRFKDNNHLGNSRSGRDEEDEIDVSLWQSKKGKWTARKQQEMDMKRAIVAEKRWESATKKREDVRQRYKHLWISLGTHSYLQLSPNSITEGHIQIIPLKHCWSFRSAAEEVVDEIKTFKKALWQLFSSQKKGLLFIETVVGKFRKEKYQTRIECIPLTEEASADASIYFKKALQEVGDQVNRSHKSIIDTSKKGLHNSIPDNFSYFHVEWRSALCSPGGFVHVIEDEKFFNRKSDFGFDVVLGLLGEDPRWFNRKKKKRGSFKEDQRRVLEFLKEWKPYDFTT